MEVVLVLFLCSSINKVCLEPIPYPKKFKDEYTCLLKGYSESIELLKNAGRENVNEHGLFYKFDCLEIEVEEEDT